MSDQEQLISASIKLLEAIQAEVQGNVESSVVAQIEMVIDNLKAAQKEAPSSITASDLLMLLGKVIEVLPAVATLLQMLQQR